MVSDVLERAKAYTAGDAGVDILSKPDEATDDLLAKLKRWFEEADEATRGSRKKAERDRDYYDNKQLTDKEVRDLEARGQPPIAINLIRRKIDFLRGMEVKQRTDPKAWPRTPGDADSAEIATDTLRYVFDAANYNIQTRKWVWKDLLVVGWGGIQLQLKAGRHDQITKAMGVQPNSRLDWKRTPWDRMFWDPHSAEHDFSDARFRGLILWKDKSEAISMYRDNPEAKSIIETVTADRSGGQTFDDKPRCAWVDGTRKRVRIVQIWWKEEDGVHWAEFTQKGILRQGMSPFFDADGESCDGFVWQSCYVDRDNNRHGAVRDMIDPQDEINKRRSKSLHLLTVRQVIADEGAVQDVEKAKRQLARPDGWITRTPGLELEIVQNADLSAGQMQLLQHATMELEKMGPNEALQGDGNATSGRDRQAQQQGGLVELGPTIDDLFWVDFRAYVLSWTTVQRNWKAPQFIRINDNPEAPKFVGLNEPMLDEAGSMVGSQNNPAEINVDLIIQPAPDTTAIEQEVWSDLTQMAPVLATLPPQLQEFYVEASPLPATRKRRLIEILKSASAPNQQQDPAQQQMMQLQMRGAQAKVEGDEAKADATRATAEFTRARIPHVAAQTHATQVGAVKDMHDAFTDAQPDDQPPPDEPEPMTPMDIADIEHKQAQTQHLKAQTFETVQNIINPPEPPKTNGLVR